MLPAWSCIHPLTTAAACSPLLRLQAQLPDVRIAGRRIEERIEPCANDVQALLAHAIGDGWLCVAPIIDDCRNQLVAQARIGSLHPPPDPNYHTELVGRNRSGVKGIRGQGALERWETTEETSRILHCPLTPGSRGVSTFMKRPVGSVRGIERVA